MGYLHASLDQAALASHLSRKLRHGGAAFTPSLPVRVTALEGVATLNPPERVLIKVLEFEYEQSCTGFEVYKSEKWIQNLVVDVS